MSHNSLFRRIPGGLTPEQLATLPLDVLEARADYLKETDAELYEIHEQMREDGIKPGTAEAAA